MSIANLYPLLAHTFSVGAEQASRPIAVLHREGRSPGLLWLGGFRSDMAGAKAEALDSWAASTGHRCTRFDYSGHGRSGGSFEEGTVSRWLEEAEFVLSRLCGDPTVLVGSSMGGWLGLLLAKRLREAGTGDLLAGMVLLAPAVDMTQALIWPRLTSRQRRTLLEQGSVAEPSRYSAEPNIITRNLMEDGRTHLFGDGPVETGCPVHVIQGMQDPDVPWSHATALMEKLAFDDAVLTLIRDGDHRLSRPEDLERLLRAVEGMVDDFDRMPAPEGGLANGTT